MNKIEALTRRKEGIEKIQSLSHAPRSDCRTKPMCDVQQMTGCPSIYGFLSILRR